MEALPREALFEVASTFCAGLISLSRTTEQMEQQDVAIREEFQRTAGGPDAPSSSLLQRPVSATPILRGVESILEHAAVQAADPYADAVQSQLARVTECSRVLTGETHSVFTEALRERSQRTPPGNRMVWAKTRGAKHDDPRRQPRVADGQAPHSILPLRQRGLEAGLHRNWIAQPLRGNRVGALPGPALFQPHRKHGAST